MTAEAWGHGYATEKARACIEWGFATLDAQYFTSMIHPDNTPSIRVAERLGIFPLRNDMLFDEPVTVYPGTLRCIGRKLNLFHNKFGSHDIGDQRQS